MKSLFFRTLGVLALLLTVLTAKAQNGIGGNVYVTHTDGTNAIYTLTPQGTITFDGDTVMVINTNGSSAEQRETISLIAKVTFDKTSTSLPNVTESGLFLYPNPVGETLHVMGLKETTDYAIYTATGQVVMQGKIADGALQVSNLRTGLYLIRLGKETIKFSKL
ncbi:MAG: T9SS type A sorting domain-containing protein [Paludibacteraceae bacterium]|nr:T9SS type A sorting domain-containing protein [Paludibacteraceae bacterium]